MRLALSTLSAALLSLSAYGAVGKTGTLADLEDQAPAAPVVKGVVPISALEEARINNQLHERMLKMAKNAREPAVINAYLELARNIKYGAPVLSSDTTLNVNSTNSDADDTRDLKNRAAFYEDFLKSIPAAEVREDFYYELSGSYDKLGQADRAIDLLKQMLKRFPTTRYASEAHFRIAEYAFSQRKFAEARKDYVQVLKDGDSRYIEQAKYLLAWTYYKDGLYDEAIEPFQSLINALQTKQKQQELNKGEALRLADSYRALSLVFVQLGGASALAKNYDGKTLDDHEIRMYNEVATRYREQKQPFNLAQTYEGFIARHPLATQTATFNSELIKVYSDAGFAKDIIRAKSDYVARFDTEQNYFQQANPELQATLRPELKANLDDLAKHYNATAQLNKSVADYARAAELYQKQLALATDSSDQVRIRELLSEALYNAAEYPRAIAVFEALAYGQPRSQNPQNAGYFALLSYQARMKQLPAEQQRAWLDQQKDSTLRYADAFARDKSTVPALLAISSQYLDLKDYTMVSGLAERILKLPNLTESDRKTSQILLANARFDLSQWTGAEAAYRQVLTLGNLKTDERTRYQNQLAASIYRQAEQAQQQPNFAEASRLYQLASDTTLDNTVKVDAAWRSAMVVGEIASAVPLLQNFYARYPTSEQANGILERIINIQTSAQDWRGAAQTYQQIYQRDRNSKPDNALAALWLAAESERKQAGGAETARKTQISAAEMALYLQYINEPRADLSQAVEASERIYQDALLKADLNTQQTEMKRHLVWIKRNDLPASVQPRLRYLAARAYTAQDQALIEQYRAIAITQPLKDSIARKQAGLQTILASQQTILDLKVAEFVTRAQFVLGDSFARFYQAVNNAPTPDGLDELATEQYKIAVEEQTTPLKEKALEWHKANYSLMIDPDAALWDAWIGQSLDALASLSAGKFARPLRKPAFAANDRELASVAALLNNKTQKSLEQALQISEALLLTRQQTLLEAKQAAAAKVPPATVDLLPLAQTRVMKGLSLLSLGRFKAAQDSFAQAEKDAPTLAEAAYLQGVTDDLYLNQAQSALAAYSRYLVLAPNDKAVQKWVNLLQKQLGLPLTKFNAPATTPDQSAAPATPLPATAVEQSP